MENKRVIARHYKLDLLKAQKKPWAASSQTSIKQVLGEDELSRIAASLFQFALTSGTYVHYSSNLTSFFKFCNLSLIDPSKSPRWTSHATSRG